MTKSPQVSFPEILVHRLRVRHQSCLPMEESGLWRLWYFKSTVVTATYQAEKKVATPSDGVGYGFDRKSRAKPPRDR